MGDRGRDGSFICQNAMVEVVFKIHFFVHLSEKGGRG